MTKRAPFTTPGPWEWRGNQLYAPGCMSTLLRDVTFWNQDPDDKALIALAPELLEYVKSSASAGCATAKGLVARALGEKADQKCP